MQFFHVYSYNIGCVSLTLQVIRCHRDQAKVTEGLTLMVIPRKAIFGKIYSEDHKN